MSDLATVRKQIRDLASKGLDITKDASLPNSKKTAQLNRIDAQLKPLMEEVDALEYVEQQRKSLGFDPWTAGSTYGTGGGVTFDRGTQFRSKAPSLTLSEHQLRDMFDAAKGMKSFRTELGTKDATADATAVGLLPNQVLPGVVERRHEVRLLERFPTSAMPGPSVEYIRHATTTGSAGAVAAGALKPELVFTPEQVVATARKLAAYTVTTMELLEDFESWAQYVQNELIRAVIDKENSQLLSGTGTGAELLGLLNTTGLLTRDYTADNTADSTVNRLDTIERAIADLRTGPALVDATDIVMHPTTWSKIRRAKDSQGRYLIGADPTQAEAQSLYGVPVFTTTTIATGSAVVANLAAAASVFVRSGLSLTSSNSHADQFQRNQVSWIAEERIALAVQRPSAVVLVSNL